MVILRPVIIDPDGNDLEHYYDRTESEWPLDEVGHSHS
jgi:catechol-2,3-dioxygenase